MVLKNLKNLKSKFLILSLLLVFCANASFSASRKDSLEWRVESTLKKLEIAPAYAGEKSPFPYEEKPVEVYKKPTRIEIPKELTEKQRIALQSAEILSEIRAILNNDNIFNADVSKITVDAIIKTDGQFSALVKNHWHAEGASMDVPIVAKENLKSLVKDLKELDPSLAEIVEDQVEEKIKKVNNFSLTIKKIFKHEVHFLDESGESHVIKFKARRF